MSLDKSWDEKSYKVADIEMSLEDLYYRGASDFQKRAIEELENSEVSKIYGEIVLPKEYVINVIKNLKAE